MSDARSRVAAALEGRLSEEQLNFLMDEVLAIRKGAWGDFTCKGCGKKQRQQVEIPDAKAVTGALVDLANQAWGRPDVAATVEDDKIMLEHVIEWGCADCDCQECRTQRGEASS